MVDLLDFIQQGQIGRTRAKVDTLESSQRHAERTLDKVDSLPDQVDRLTLVCQAMWELLKQHVGLSEKQILDKVKEIDLRDGKADNKIKVPVKECSDCGRVMNPRHKKCIYCGKERLVESVFELI